MIFQHELIKSLITHHSLTAIEGEVGSVSYAELFSRANTITAFLLKQSLPAETVIGIDLQDRTSLIAAIIGIMNSRCVFVPVDASLPKERLNAMAVHMNLRYLITDCSSTFVAKVGAINDLQPWYLEDIQKHTSEEDREILAYPSFDGEDSLYIYFTSGSTGIPKGIIGKNKSLLQFLQWETRTFGITTTSRVSQLISPYFDAFLRDVFAPLLVGGTICIPPQHEHFFEPATIAGWLNDQHIHLVHCVPGVFRLINNAPLSTEHFTELQYILLSGERIIPAELVKWYVLFGDRIQLVNLYGATETTMIRAFYKIEPADAESDRIPIGYPIDDTELLIATKDMKPCQPLVAGELYIISAYTSKGYLNAPELTAERFIKINAGTPREKIAFKTGDTARLLANGKIDLLGRDDRQVKLRGIRIELDEIENRLLQSGMVGQALVVKQEENGNESLVAFVTRHHNLMQEVNLPNAAEAYIRQYLPAYMIPAQIREVAEFPVLRNGKINQQELLKTLAHHTILPPAGKTEEKVLAVWQQILGDKPISVTDSFNKIGGNSLNIMRLIGILYKAFNVRITLSELFNNLTIREQAALIGQSQQDTVLLVEPAAPKPSYHLSAVQERMYYNYELNRQRTAYNMPIAWTISSEVGPEQIERSLQLLIQRHESLRTRITMVNHILQQVIEETIDFKIEEYHTSNIQAAFAAFIRPFDLDIAPLFRAAIITSGRTKILAIDMHHIICDGLSQVILRADFLALYRNKPLQPLAVQYKDYAEWEYNFRATNEYLRNREFWLQSFEGTIPRLDLPVTNEGQEENTEAGGNLIFAIPGDMISRITAPLQQQEVTTFSALMAVYFLFLYQLTGQEDIVVGTNTTGKMQAELEGVTGMFTKTLPIRYQVVINEPFNRLAQKLHDYLVEAYSHQLYDLADIVSEVSGRNATPVSSLFETMFVFQNFEEHPDAGKEFSEYNFDQTTSKYPLTMIANENGNTFYFRLEYATRDFTPADVELLAEQFKWLVTQIAENASAPIAAYISNNEPSSSVVDSDIVFNF